MAGRTPLFNAELQSNLDGNDFNINTVNAVDAIHGGTVYVDAALPTEIGKIGSSMAFKTLGAALSAAPAGYTIIVRPGTYAYDGVLQVRRAHLKIFGAGAIITPATAGESVGLIVSANYVTIDGLEFDGLLSGTPTDTGSVIEIARATNTTLSNLLIHDHNGVGIALTDRYDSTEITSCNITTCYRAITGVITTAGQDIAGIGISNNKLQNCRAGGIVIHGNDNTDVIKDIRITGNDISNCDTAGVNAAGVDVSAGCEDINIAHNYIIRCYYGVYTTLSQRVSISSNSLVLIDGALIHNDGNKFVTISANLLDGSSPSGSGHCPIGIAMVGFYSIVGNDAGPYTIAGNIVTGIYPNGKFINTANANDILIEGNQFTGNAYISALSFNGLKITNNNFIISSTNSVIQMDADTRGWKNCTISDNRFKLAVTTGWTRLIGTTDTLAKGQSNLVVVGNWSTEGVIYSAGLLDNVNGADPTNVFQHSNTPQVSYFDRSGGAPDRRKGWVNDYQVALISDRVNIPTDSPTKYQVGGSQVVGSRITGWSLPTSATTRTTFDATTVTLPELAKRVATLIRDLHITGGHGLIGFYS